MSRGALDRIGADGSIAGLGGCLKLELRLPRLVSQDATRSTA
jgi:hypothetical protein